MSLIGKYVLAVFAWWADLTAGPPGRIDLCLVGLRAAVGHCQTLRAISPCFTSH